MERDIRALRDGLRSLDRRGSPPDYPTLTLLLARCCNLKALREGKRIHAYILRRRLGHNVFLANFLITMYGKCGSVSDARLMFDTMPHRNVVSWNAMISVYAQHKLGKKALRLVGKMREEGIQPKRSTYVSALNACASPEVLKELKCLNESIDNGGHGKDLIVGNALINAYGKCGGLLEARRVFREMQERDIITWNSMIAAYAQHGYINEALKLLNRMKMPNVEADKVSFVNILSGCTNHTHSGIGRRIYEIIRARGYQSHVFVGTALITMFGKCGSSENAYKIFDGIKDRSVVSWNAMISAFVQCGCKKEAVQLFQRMQKELVKPDKVTFISVLDACTDPAALELGRAIHSYARRCKMDDDTLVRSALVSMYGKCGSLQEAVRVFSSMWSPDMVSWTAMIGTYANLGFGDEALGLFAKMNHEEIMPNQVTYINVISACAVLCSAIDGKLVHTAIIQKGYDSVLVVANALINMYSKCGSVDDAEKVFDTLRNKNLVSWTSMLDACASHGCGKEALHIFRRMQHDGIKPDEVTFVSVLTACNHSGLLDDALEFFFSMIIDHGIAPNINHYSCMIDMLARVGELDGAERFIDKMPFKSGLVEWMALLGACKSNGDIARAGRAAKQVLSLSPTCSAAYLILWSIYTANNKWDDAFRLRALMMQHGIEISLDHD